MAAEGRMLAYASGNFGKALVFGGADMTILFLLTDVLALNGAQTAGLMLVALVGDLVFDLLAAPYRPSLAGGRARLSLDRCVRGTSLWHRLRADLRHAGTRPAPGLDAGGGDSGLPWGLCTG
jgi:hypothetical protein